MQKDAHGLTHRDRIFADEAIAALGFCLIVEVKAMRLLLAAFLVLGVAMNAASQSATNLWVEVSEGSRTLAGFLARPPEGGPVRSGGVGAANWASAQILEGSSVRFRVRGAQGSDPQGQVVIVRGWVVNRIAQIHVLAVSKRIDGPESETLLKNLTLRTGQSRRVSLPGQSNLDILVSDKTQNP